MSMLSAQCDELRAMAESVGLAMPQAATLMMGAADAIDRLDAENAELRELCTEIWNAWQYSEFSMMPKLFDRMCELGVEVE